MNAFVSECEVAPHAVLTSRPAVFAGTAGCSGRTDESCGIRRPAPFQKSSKNPHCAIKDNHLYSLICEHVI
jgi:hypothetical protein